MRKYEKDNQTFSTQAAPITLQERRKADQDDPTFNSALYLVSISPLWFRAFAVSLGTFQAILLALPARLLGPAVGGQIRTGVQQNLVENPVGDAS